MSGDAWVQICSATGGCVAAFAAGQLVLDGHIPLGIANLALGALIPLAAMHARKGLFEKIKIIANADRKDWAE